MANKKVTRLMKSKPEKVNGFPFKKALQMHLVFGKLLPLVTGKAHTWLFLAHTKLKPILEAYNSALRTHEDYEAYGKELKDGILSEDAKETFSGYLEYCNKLVQEDSGLEIRKFKVEWFVNMEPHADFSTMLLNFNLLDDPESLEDMLYK